MIKNFSPQNPIAVMTHNTKKKVKLENSQFTDFNHRSDACEHMLTDEVVSVLKMQNTRLQRLQYLFKNKHK